MRQIFSVMMFVRNAMSSSYAASPLPAHLMDVMSQNSTRLFLQLQNIIYLFMCLFTCKQLWVFQQSRFCLCYCVDFTYCSSHLLSTAIVLNHYNLSSESHSPFHATALSHDRHSILPTSTLLPHHFLYHHRTFHPIPHSSS